MKFFAISLIFIFGISVGVEVFADSLESINRPDIQRRIVLPSAFSPPPENFQSQKDFAYVDPTRLIDSAALKRALNFFEYNFTKMLNPRFLTLIDFTKNESTKRLFQIDMKSGEVMALHVSVGKGSDPDGDGNADSFSNIPNSYQSSLGFYLTDDEYNGGNGRSLRLHGLSSTNDNALSRFIVIHGATYVSEEFNHAGRSLGCPAVDMKYRDQLIDNVKGGSLLYVFFN